jgi:hypothetical protein
MSTKIYYAWEWKSGIKDLLVFFQRLKKAYITESVWRLKKYCNGLLKRLKSADPRFEDKKNRSFELAYFLPDPGFEDEKISSFELAYFLRQQIQAGKNEPINVSFSAVIYFQDNKIIVQFFGIESYKRLDDLVSNYPEFSYYGYWDNTDPDEECSDKEWEEREVFYDKLFERYPKPIDVGLIYEFNDIFTLEKIAKRILNRKQDGTRIIHGPM